MYLRIHTGTKIAVLEQWRKEQTEEIRKACIMEAQEKLDQAENFITLCNIITSLKALEGFRYAKAAAGYLLEHYSESVVASEKQNIQKTYRELSEKWGIEMEFEDPDLNKEMDQTGLLFPKTPAKKKKKRHKPSILQDKNHTCYLCILLNGDHHKHRTLHEHHIFGGPNRIHSEEDGRFSCSPALPPPSKADWAFMLHILHHMSDNGVAVVLEFPGILYRGQREGKIRKWFVENNYIDRVVNIPGNTFEDTSIATCIVVLRKNKITTDVLFEDGERVEVVSYEAIKENSFTLTPSIYLLEENEKEEIDPCILENEARRNFLHRLKKELDFDKMVCELQGISMKPFISAIKRVLREYETKPCDRSGQQMSIFDFPEYLPERKRGINHE